MKFIKHTICILFLSSSINAYPQYIPSTITEYSKPENGSIGSEKFTFSLYNSYITIVDNYYNTSKKYGPLYLDETGYNKEGFYFELFKPDIKNHWEEFRGGRQPTIVYRILYDNKGGNILFIDEIKAINSYKTYYTEKGYLKSTKNNNSSNNYELKETNFDINDVVLNSTSLSQIMSKINFSFEQYGEKKISEDGQIVSVSYRNSSLIKPLIRYTTQGSVKEIMFIAPISNALSIQNVLTKKYGTKYIDGNEVIQKGDLKYEFRGDDTIGLIVIY